MNASAPPTTDRYHIQIKESTERAWWFLSSRGGGNRLRVHAIEISAFEAAQVLTQNWSAA
jgi:transcriptional regulator CtsR